MLILGDSISVESIDLTPAVEDIYHRINNDEMVQFRKATENIS